MSGTENIVVAAGEGALAWRAHPAADRPGRAVAAGATIAAAAALVGVWCALDGLPVLLGIGIGIAAAALLVLTLHKFFFPSSYEIDDTGVTARFLLRTQSLPWSRVRRFLHDEHGGYLSTRATPSRFDAFRGLHVLFGEDGTQVIRAIETMLPAAQRGDAA